MRVTLLIALCTLFISGVLSHEEDNKEHHHKRHHHARHLGHRHRHGHGEEKHHAHRHHHGFHRHHGLLHNRHHKRHHGQRRDGDVITNGDTQFWDIILPSVRVEHCTSFNAIYSEKQTLLIISPGPNENLSGVVNGSSALLINKLNHNAKHVNATFNVTQLMAGTNQEICNQLNQFIKDNAKGLDSGGDGVFPLSNIGGLPQVFTNFGSFLNNFVKSSTGGRVDPQGFLNFLLTPFNGLANNVQRQVNNSDFGKFVSDGVNNIGKGIQQTFNNISDMAGKIPLIGDVVNGTKDMFSNGQKWINNMFGETTTTSAPSSTASNQGSSSASGNSNANGNGTVTTTAIPKNARAHHHKRHHEKNRHHNRHHIHKE